MAKGQKSEAQREAVALLLASGQSQEKAAAAHGAAPRTVRHWMKNDPAFAALVRKTRAGLFERGFAILAGGHSLAAVKLVELLGSSDERVRLSAAHEVLTLGRALRETDEFAVRLAALETAEQRREKESSE